MLVTSILLTLLTFFTLGEARGTIVKRNLAPRSVPSAGNYRCYFSCPPATNGGTYTGVDHSAEDYYGAGSVYCNYSNGYCVYQADGSLDFGSRSDCPAQAQSAGCTDTGNPPNSDTDFRKRSLPRRKTEAEQRLAARQYNPKKNRTQKRSAQGEKAKAITPTMVT